MISCSMTSVRFRCVLPFCGCHRYWFDRLKGQRDTYSATGNSTKASAIRAFVPISNTPRIRPGRKFEVSILPNGRADGRTVPIAEQTCQKTGNNDNYAG